MKTRFLIIFVVAFLSACSSSNEDEESQSSENQSSSCSKVLSLTVFDIGNTTANLFWTANEDSSSFEVEYGVEGFSLGNGTVLNSTESSLLIEDLIKSTDYSYYVRAFCEDSNEFSEWSEPFNFRTKEQNPFCDNPLSLTADTKSWLYPTQTHNTIHVSWTGGSVDGVEIQYGIYPFVLGQGTIVIGQNTNSFGGGVLEVSGLEPDTRYGFYVRNICTNAGYSDWIGDWDAVADTQETPFNVNCKDPTDFDTNPGTGNGYISFSWSENYESSWDIHIIPEGSPINPNETNTYNVTDNHFGLMFTNENGYVHGQQYDFYVRANCGAEGNSGWVGPLTWTAGY